MNFVSWAFVGLFAVTFLARLTIGRRKTEPAYIGVLLVASLRLLRLAHADLPD